MGYSIQPVTIWQNGQQNTANFIDATIVNDNLTDRAIFYWSISNATQVDDQTVKNQLSQGNVTITGQAYSDWGAQSDVNFAAYEYICEQLNLTLIP